MNCSVQKISWNVLCMEMYSMKCLSVNCHVYKISCLWKWRLRNCVHEISCIWNIMSMKYHVYEISCPWNIMYMKYHVYEISCPWNIMYMKYHVYEISCPWNPLSMKYHAYEMEMYSIKRSIYELSRHEISCLVSMKCFNTRIPPNC